MNRSVQAPKRARMVRAILVVIGVAVLAYAATDHPFYGGAPGFGMDQVAICLVGLAIAASALLPATWSSRALLVVLSSFFTIAVAEVGVDLVLGHRYRAPYDYSERYLFQLRPNVWSSYRHPDINGGNTVLHRINSQGLRGEELRPRGEATRVVVYGDSFIHAFYTPLEETFTEQLEDQLETKLGREVEVVNAGTSSYGPDQVMLRMEQELDPLAPDLVILAVFAGNDFGDLIRNKMFAVDEQGALKARPFELAQEFRVKFDLSHRESILRMAIRKARATTQSPGHAAAAAGGKDPGIAMMDEWLEIAGKEYADYWRDDVVREPSVDRYTADNSLQPNSEAARYKVSLMEAVLRRAAAAARKRDVPFMLLFIPHPVDVMDTHEHGRVDMERFPDYRRTNLTGSLVGIAQRVGADHVDLYDAFRQRRGVGLYYRGGDDHWNSAGQKLAAEITADHIIRSAVLGDRAN